LTAVFQRHIGGSFATNQLVVQLQRCSTVVLDQEADESIRAFLLALDYLNAPARSAAWFNSITDKLDDAGDDGTDRDQSCCNCCQRKQQSLPSGLSLQESLSMRFGGTGYSVHVRQYPKPGTIDSLRYLGLDGAAAKSRAAIQCHHLASV
jgi:hypothetical protein